MANSFNLKVLTPNRTRYEGEAEMVILPGVQGEFAILHDHMPIVAALKHGIMTIRSGGQDKIASVVEGFVQVVNNQVTVTVTGFDWPDEIDKNRAQEELELAERKKNEAKSELELKQAELAIRRASVKLEACSYSAARVNRMVSDR